MTISIKSVNFFCYVCFTGKNENLAETPILKNFFIFVANSHSFQIFYFLMENIKFS